MTDTMRLGELALAHATKTYARLRPDDTVDEALRSIPEQALDTAITYFYVVDASGVLRGVVPTRRLLTAPRHTRVVELMTDAHVTLPLTATLRDAAALLHRHRLLAVPIVGQLGRMHGVVDATMLGLDATAGVTGRQADEWFHLLGVRTQTQAAAVRSRMASLLWNVGGGLVAAGIVSLYDGLVTAVTGLAFFMPVTLALSESVGMQAVAMALTTSETKRSGLLPALRRESRAAPLLAMTCATLVGVAAIAWRTDYRLIATVVTAIAVAMTVSGLIGAFVPRVIRACSANPTVAAGPIVLALADFVSLIVYFGVGAALLS